MSKNQYIHLPNGNTYVNIGRTGSSSINKAIAEQLFPERLPKAYAELTHKMWHINFLERSEDVVGQAIVLVRDPIERFRSYCAHLKVQSVDWVLGELEAGRVDELNGFNTVTSRLGETNLLFKFPDHIEEAAMAIGISELSPINEQPEENKPNLTPDQLLRVEAYYADDITLYNSISAAGQIHIVPAEPATAELKAQKIAELEAARFQAEVAGIELPDGRFIRTDKETQAELGKALSVISAINPDLEIDWKFPYGTVVALDAEQIKQIAAAVFAHVQATRTSYKEKAALVESATTKDELDAILW